MSFLTYPWPSPVPLHCFPPRIPRSVLGAVPMPFGGPDLITSSPRPFQGVLEICLSVMCAS